MRVVYYEKAFDRTKHDELMKILESPGLGHKDLRIIKNIYFEQITSVKVKDQTTEGIQIK